MPTKSIIPALGALTKESKWAALLPAWQKSNGKCWLEKLVLIK